MTDREARRQGATYCSVCGRRVLTNRVSEKCWKHRPRPRREIWNDYGEADRREADSATGRRP